MKKLAVLVVALVMTTSLFAQEKPIRLGVFLGPNITWLAPDIEHFEGNGASMGFAWGLVTDVTLMENYYLTSGIKLNYFKGKIAAPVAAFGNLEQEFNMRYLEIPLALKLRTNELLPRMKFYGTIGLEAGVRIRAKSNISATVSGVVQETEKVDVKEITQPVICNLAVGAGMEFAVDDALDIVAGVSFHNGLTGALKSKKSNPIQYKAMPYYFSFDIAVLF